MRERAERSVDVEPSPSAEPAAPADKKVSPEELQRRAREAWLALRAKDPNARVSIEQQQRQARERWKAYQQSKGASPDDGKDKAQERDKSNDRWIEDDL